MGKYDHTIKRSEDKDAEEKERKRKEYYIDCCRIPVRYVFASLENYDIRDNTEALEKVKAWYSRFEKEYGCCSLTLAGGVGTGKTHIATAIGNMVLAECSSVIFITTTELLNEFKRRYEGNTGNRQKAYTDPDEYRQRYLCGYQVLNFDSLKTPDDLMDCLQNVHLLILDDIGAENSTEWAVSQLDCLVNSRYNNEMATIFTTNHGDKLPPRIKDRLDEGVTVVLKGESYRKAVGIKQRQGVKA